MAIDPGVDTSIDPVIGPRINIDPGVDIGVEPLTGRIGAVLTGVDLATADDDVATYVRRALSAHRVVFVRDQHHLDAAGQIAFARRLGPLTLAHPTLPALPGEALELFDLDSVAGAAANHWHTDVTFVERPPIFSVLRAVVIPPVGGDTQWANTVAAYRDLPDDLRELAGRLRAVHSNGHDYGRVDVAKLAGKLSAEQVEYITTFVSTVYETEHPVARVHPETGEPALLLGGFAHRLAGHGAAESVDLIRVFQSYVTRPENVVRWKWRAGDVAIWDNRSTQHYAVSDYGRQRRRVQRVTTAGVPVLGLDGSTSTSLQGDATAYYAAG
ncbi:MAG TPA: TauD/TfdA family dioxygenase [Acidimicrobiales bacterium]|nr:TauD/TfdA family dioxygenase [Acidimicrobiales bacterium]